jgi:hypothetical protein
MVGSASVTYSTYKYYKYGRTKYCTVHQVGNFWVRDSNWVLWANRMPNLVRRPPFAVARLPSPCARADLSKRIYLRAHPTPPACRSSARRRSQIAGCAVSAPTVVYSKRHDPIPHGSAVSSRPSRDANPTHCQWSLLGD